MSCGSEIKEADRNIPNYIKGIKRKMVKKYKVKIYGNNPIVFLVALLDFKRN